jgi:hypothetical protein
VVDAAHTGARAPAAVGAIPKLAVPKNVEIELKLA